MKKEDVKYYRLLKTITSGCKFKYISYDHKKAMKEYATSEDYEDFQRWLPNPDCHGIPLELKEKYKVEKIGKLRSIDFAPNGKAWKFKIGKHYSKSFFLEDFGVTVFPLKKSLTK